MENDLFNNEIEVFKLLKKSYHSELVVTIDLIGQYVKGSVVIDGDLLSVEFFDDFGGRYNLTVESLADSDFQSYRRFCVILWFDGNSIYRSVFTNISFVRQTVRMLLEWYVESDN